jgi:hypothetical protein
MKTIKLNESQLRKMIRKQLGEARGLGMQGVARHDRRDPRHPGFVGTEIGATKRAEPAPGPPARSSRPYDPEAVRDAAIQAIKAVYGPDAVLESDDEEDEMEDED